MNEINWMAVLVHYKARPIILATDGLGSTAKLKKTYSGEIKINLGGLFL